MGLHLFSLYNSLTRQVEPFRSLKKGEVKIFTCGPSIYQRPHIGNYRTFLFEDILQRYLEYQGYEVTRVLNVTDVEDKSIEEAKKMNMDVLELTEKYSKKFFEDLELLKIKPPTYTPRSSTSVDQAVRLIQDLLKKGYAYWHKGNIYFDPLNFEDFGKLGHLDKSRWPKVKKRYHKDTYPGNRWNLGDFIIWHGYRNGDPIYWDTPLGKGRPAWNIQDPAMAVQTLGYCVDICCGGEDNQVRHHDYTIAITESVSGKSMATYWLHGAHLLVDGKKMSKSKGNVIYLDDLVKAGYTAEEVRFFLIYGSYRKRLNFTFDRIEKTAEKLRQVCGMIALIKKAGIDVSTGRAAELIEWLEQDFRKNMDDDLDVKHAFDDLSAILKKKTVLADRKQVSQQETKRIITVLTDIDKVLQIFKLPYD
jgi:cysteinyl-tRNA synthetase